LETRTEILAALNVFDECFARRLLEDLLTSEKEPHWSDYYQYIAVLQRSNDKRLLSDLVFHLLMENSSREGSPFHILLQLFKADFMIEAEELDGASHVLRRLLEAIPKSRDTALKASEKKQFPEGWVPVIAPSLLGRSAKNLVLKIEQIHGRVQELDQLRPVEPPYMDEDCNSALMHEAEQLMDRQEYKDALELLNRVKARFFHDAARLYPLLLAALFSLKEEADLFCVCCDLLHEGSPLADTALAYYGMGLYYQLVGRLDDARRAFA